MNDFVKLKCTLNNQELEKIYDSYRTRTQYAMNNFIILRAINELLINISDFNQFPKKFLKIVENKLVASDDFALSWTTKTDVNSLWRSVQEGRFISYISYPVLVELVAALDEAFVKIINLYMPKIDLKKIKSKKYKTKYLSKEIIIDSKTLIYPYVVYRHCYKNYGNSPLLFGRSDIIPRINMTIKLRHMIIHNDAKFDNNKDNYFYGGMFKDTFEDDSLKFKKNRIDSIFNDHAMHLANFICWLDKNAEIYLSTEFNPKPEFEDFTHFIKE